MKDLRAVDIRILGTRMLGVMMIDIESAFYGCWGSGSSADLLTVPSSFEASRQIAQGACCNCGNSQTFAAPSKTSNPHKYSFHIHHLEPDGSYFKAGRGTKEQG